jgi:hypothetical protein
VTAEEFVRRCDWAAVRDDLTATRAQLLGRIDLAELDLSSTGRPSIQATERLASWRRNLAEVEGFLRMLERGAAKVTRKYGRSARHWPAAVDLAWQHRRAVAIVEGWQAEVAAGRRPMTPQLAEAIRAELGLVARLDAKLGEGGGQDGESTAAHLSLTWP